jgi:hypothetical protein
VRWLGAGALGAAALVLVLTHIEITGGWKGIYLLRGVDQPFVLRDDIFLGEATRALASVSFSAVRSVADIKEADRPAGAWLESEWDEAAGRGIVRNHLADGSEMQTALSRWDNGGEDGGVRHGVFVGGSLPDIALDLTSLSQSGMAYRERSGIWRHVWCNANEAIWDVAQNREIDTYQYRYLGSAVLVRDSQRLVIESSHEVIVSGVPLRMRRVAQFAAGKPYLLLGVSIENLGTVPVRYMFLYGDEPWVGKYGSAAGNLGWTGDGIFAEEAPIDPVRHRWAGIVDTETGTANFLAWLGADFPSVVYVSNDVGTLVPGKPLASEHIFIGTEWNREIGPGEVQHVLLAIGMAERDAGGHLRPTPDIFARHLPEASGAKLPGAP